MTQRRTPRIATYYRVSMPTRARHPDARRLRE